MWPKLKTLSQRGEKWNSIGVQYLAETYTLYNHFTVCSPNFRLFRRMAKTGLESIYANESYILPEPMLCATFLRHVAQTRLSRAKGEIWTFIDLWEWVQYLANVFFVQPFYGMWPKPQNFSQNLGRKLDWNRSMRMSPIFSQNECFVQPFHDRWPKLQTFSQKGEKWTSIALCERVLYFAKPRALCNHFTTIGLNYRLFRKKAKMEFHWSMRMSPIFSQKVYSAQPFYGMWPKIQTFWQKNVLHSIYVNGVQYSVETHPLSNHFKTSCPNYVLSTDMRKKGWFVRPFYGLGP